MARHMFTLHAYKFNLSGNLILLLDLRSSSTGGVLAVPIGEADSGGPGTGTTYRGISCSPRSAAREMELATATSSGTSSLRI